ncbi:MAG TPA: penicillin-binding transpeptidase domain-containing protein [Acidobacteriaceae bacterium]|nr:penicillin-binding transpeptidase domain-containing protein [Acidobacteriaceae bacterium]
MKQLSFSPGQTRSRPADGGRRAGEPGRTSVPLAPRRLRFLHIACLFLIWVTAICCRLVWLQVVRHADFVERAAKQQQRTFEVAPRRGILYDRNLHALAMTVLADSVYAVPSEIAEKQDPSAMEKYRAAAAILARVVHTDPTDRFTSVQQIAARLNASRNFAWVARKLDSKEIERVKALKVKGIYIQKEFKRFYPDSDLAAQLLGYVGTDDNGLGGMERGFDRDLHGVPGRMLTALDARRHVLGSQERDPEPGENLVLTIDENIQFIAERALDEALERTHAQNGTVVVQDPNTGQILALAIRPTFNPNDFRHATTSLLRDHAISDVYEPGSTFKLVTYSAALEQKVTNPNEVIDCQGGKIELAGRIIHDDHPNYLLTTTQALWESSDVAAVKLALRMGSDTFYKYIRAYGFGSRSGIELPNETRGLLRPPRRWSGSSIGSIAMGQEVAVTPIQLVTMASSLANGGVYLPPHILMQRTQHLPGDGTLKPAAFQPEHEVQDPLPSGAHRVVSTMTAAEMRKIMEGVVQHGTGTTAQLNGYSAGGKTGTAQKIDVATHRYSKTNYVASFVGFAPINNPAISVAVVIDSPKGNHFGHTVSAPVFQEVAQQVLEYLGVPHDEPLHAPQQLAKSQEENEAPPEQSGDLNALFDAVNDLPADDPLRTEVAGQQRLPSSAGDLPSSVAAGSSGRQQAPQNPVAAQPAEEAAKSTAAMSQPVDLPAAKNAPARPPVAIAQTLPNPVPGKIVVDSLHRVAVPALVGQPMRQAVESAGVAGLSLQIVGSGIAREQVPAPGTLVPPGTGVVVRFSR